MVIAAPIASSVRSSTSAVPKNPISVPRKSDASPNPSRRPLIPSEKDNAAMIRRPRVKEISSRYLSSYSSSSSSITSSSCLSNATTSSSCTPSFRRFPSPLPNRRPSTPSAFLQRSDPRRSQSVDRTRPATPEASNAARALCTRSLSVSFQGESFFYQTSKAKAISPVPSRNPTQERRRVSTLARNSSTSSVEKPSEYHHCWPAGRSSKSILLSKSLDCSSDKDPVLSTVQLLRRSMLFDDGTRTASFDGGELSVSSDTDSLSSGSNSGTPEFRFRMRGAVSSGGVGMPDRFRQETKNRLRSIPQPGTPLSSSNFKKIFTPKVSAVRRSSVDSSAPLPRSASSPLRGPVRTSSPSKLVDSPSKGFPSPSRARDSSVLSSSTSGGHLTNVPSIVSFAAESRRSKKGESRIEEAHMLRLLYNQHLQWRHVNARTNAVLMVQSVFAEKKLYNAWLTSSELYNLVTIEKIKLLSWTHDLKQGIILEGQMVYLEEWFNLERDLSSSLSGAIEALKAITLRLPVINGARAELQEVKDAVASAVDVMQAMGASICSLLSKVEGTSSLLSKLTEIAAQEQILLNQSRDLLSAVTALHVKQCSRRAHFLQLKQRPNKCKCRVNFMTN